MAEEAAKPVEKPMSESKKAKVVKAAPIRTIEQTNTDGKEAVAVKKQVKVDLPIDLL